MWQAAVLPGGGGLRDLRNFRRQCLRVSCHFFCGNAGDGGVFISFAIELEHSRASSDLIGTHDFVSAKIHRFQSHQFVSMNGLKIGVAHFEGKALPFKRNRLPVMDY